MATEVSASLRKATEAIIGDRPDSKKIKDLHRDTVDVHSDQPMTTDWGHKISNTDNWLRIANEKSTGPNLLEDQQAREKASAAALSTLPSNNPASRFIALIMSVFPSVWFMPAEQVLSANSLFSKA